MSSHSVSQSINQLLDGGNRLTQVTGVMVWIEDQFVTSLRLLINHCNRLNTTGPSDEAPPLTHRPPPLDDPMTSTSRGASYVESIILLIVSAFYAIQAADNTMSSHWLNATRSDPIMDHSRRADYPASFLNIPKFKV